MCLYPKILPNPKYKANKKNGGIIPELKDPRVYAVPVGCGKCMECMKKKSRDWQIRLTEEVRSERHGAEFITLTFDTENLKKLTEELLKNNPKLSGYDLDNAIADIALKRFNERWKKKHGTRLKHWMITELGHTNYEHLHIHGIVWNKTEPSSRASTNHKIRKDFRESLKETWKYGRVDLGDYVNERTVNYITKYCSKMDEDHKYYKPIIRATNGLGINYLKRHDSSRNKFNENGETIEYYKSREGFKIGLPIYYRNKLYTDEQREKLWIQKLDKNERWVLGSKIDISKGDEIYFACLKEAQEKNDRLGYGNDRINWERVKYEESRRNLIYQHRTNLEISDKNNYLDAVLPPIHDEIPISRISGRLAQILNQRP